MTFEEKIEEAIRMQDTDTVHSDYWIGYGVGLYRAHYGAPFENTTAYKLFIKLSNLVNANDKLSIELEAGYLEGVIALRKDNGEDDN